MHRIRGIASPPVLASFSHVFLQHSPSATLSRTAIIARKVNYPWFASGVMRAINILIASFIRRATWGRLCESPTRAHIFPLVFLSPANPLASSFLSVSSRLCPTSRGIRRDRWEPKRCILKSRALSKAPGIRPLTVPFCLSVWEKTDSLATI